jgi:hypothetical protein
MVRCVAAGRARGARSRRGASRDPRIRFEALFVCGGDGVVGIVPGLLSKGPSDPAGEMEARYAAAQDRLARRAVDEPSLAKVERDTPM